MWKTFGHKKQKGFLENVLRDGSYSHAYLFSGPDQVGKKTLALEFAAKILGIEDPSKFNPDLILLSGDSYKVEDVRKLISDLSLRPYQSEYKVAVLDNAHFLTEEAANALLKTLEEPSRTSIIILVTSNKNLLLPTIASRAQLLNFSRVLLEELETADLPHLWNSPEHTPFISGKIGKAIAAGAREEEKDKFRSRELEEVRSGSIGQRLAMIKSFSDMDSDELSEVLKNWLDYEHYNFLKGLPEKYKNLRLLMESLQGLQQNFNKKLVLEKLFLNIV